MRIVNVSEVDEMAQRFRVVGYLLAQWKDSRLTFTPQSDQEQYRIYPPDEVWTPHLDFINGIVPHSAFDKMIRVYPDGTVKYSERSSAELSNVFHLQRFPFDRQTLEILIHPPLAEGEIVQFTRMGGSQCISAEPRVFDSLPQWNVTGLSSSFLDVPGPSDEPIGEIRFTISIVRRFNFYIWKVFLPLVLMVCLSWTVLWIEPSELSAQVTISVTTILTVIAFAFAIQANLPKVPYLTFIDLFFLICYLFVFITAIGITAVHAAGQSHHRVRMLRLSRLARVILPTAFVIAGLIIIAYSFT